MGPIIFGYPYWPLNPVFRSTGPQRPQTTNRVVSPERATVTIEASGFADDDSISATKTVFR